MWSENKGDEWDGGLTVWDESGNIILTYWDVATDEWAATTGTTTEWADLSNTTASWISQSVDPETSWDGGVTLWDVFGNVAITDWDARGSQWEDISATAATWTEV